MSRTDAKLDRLGAVSMFRHCTKKQLQKIGAIADELDLAEGHVLCQQGSMARECFVIIDGKAAVSIDGDDIAVVGPGESVGEMALLNRKPRVATVTALTPIRAYVIHGAQLRLLLEEAPSVALSLLETLSERLRELEAQALRNPALA